MLTTNNLFKNQYNYGIYLRYQNSPTISNNIFTTNSTYNGFGAYAISIRYCDNAVTVTKNEIRSASTAGNKYGINIEYCDGSLINNGLIANNMIAVGDTANASSNYGIRLRYSFYMNILNNQYFS